MDSIERIIRATPLPANLPNGNGQNARRALVHASLATAVGRKGRHLTGTFCLTGDTMEGIIQCLVFLKAFSVSSQSVRISHFHTHSHKTLNQPFYKSKHPWMKGVVFAFIRFQSMHNATFIEILSLLAIFLIHSIHTECWSMFFPLYFIYNL